MLAAAYFERALCHSSFLFVSTPLHMLITSINQKLPFLLFLATFWLVMVNFSWFSLSSQEITANAIRFETYKYFSSIFIRGGVLKDVFGLENTFEVLGLGLKFSKNCPVLALASSLGSSIPPLIFIFSKFLYFISEEKYFKLCCTKTFFFDKGNFPNLEAITVSYSYRILTQQKIITSS